MSRNWERLPLHNKSYPPLLFSYEPSPKGYEILLTDLAHIWSENLSHKQIINRASKEETSIDPSQDEDQYLVLLQKIGDALRGSKGSSICLSGHKAGSSLKLVTTTKLPKPLEPLEWRLDLFQLSPSALTRHLLLPALQRGSDAEDRQYSLFELLKEKDKIIGKLFDKIESSGLDLSTVFTGMANVRLGHNRGSLFSQASKLVKGVGPFDQGSWEHERSEHGLDKFGTNCMGKALYDDDVLDPRSLERIQNGWWHHSTTSDGAQSPGEPHSQKDDKRAMEKDVIESEDEFQRQETPPRLRGNEASPSPEVAENKPDVEMTSSKDRDKEHLKSPQMPVSKSKKIGSLGKPKPKKQLAQDSHDSATSDASEPSLPPRGQPKSLGSIGGRKPKASSKQPDSGSATSGAGQAVKSHAVSNVEDQTTDSEVDDDEEFSKPKKRKQPQQYTTDAQK
ncbi:hypothetical protein FQN49_008203, partial [Arthroderma sp. PD_2]